MLAKGITQPVMLHTHSYTLSPIEAETKQLQQHSTAYTISAGMAHIAQYTWLLADILDVHLSYPYSLVTAISDYGQCDLSEQEFRANVVRLNNNVVHLCFMQVSLVCVHTNVFHIYSTCCIHLTECTTLSTDHLPHPKKPSCLSNPYSTRKVHFVLPCLQCGLE